MKALEGAGWRKGSVMREREKREAQKSVEALKQQVSAKVLSWRRKERRRQLSRA